ncbi:MAG: ATP-binding protein [Acholeplasmatales bacterium]|nr:MAG: ATP-binding protein [Acholeplasmatales bacterium]
MATFLRNIVVKGIKNLCEDVSLNFSNKEFKQFSECQKSNVKAIYGPNGSGKTALVHAFRIFKEIITENGYLYDTDNAKYLLALMNKQCRVISVKVDFFHADTRDKKPKIFTYAITLNHKTTGFEIQSERFSSKSSEYSKESVLFETKEGILTTYTLAKNSEKLFQNLLKKRSFGDILIEVMNKHQETHDTELSETLSEILEAVAPLISLAFGLKVVLDQKDDHTHVFLNATDRLTQVLTWRKNHEELVSVMTQTGYDTKLVAEETVKKMQEEAKKKTQFIKLFKPHIQAIEVLSKPVQYGDNETLYSVNEFVNYGDYKVDVEIESAGIKKLLDLFASIKHVVAGGLLVIDELDAHINDVYLIKLIDYVARYARGQLIFTTHNVSPMEILKSKKHGIDFMTLSGKVVSWTQTGNYSPSSLYKKGMVQGLPFNLDSESFLGVFSDES